MVPLYSSVCWADDLVYHVLTSYAQEFHLPWTGERNNKANEAGENLCHRFLKFDNCNPQVQVTGTVEFHQQGYTNLNLASQFSLPRYLRRCNIGITMLIVDRWGCFWL